MNRVGRPARTPAQERLYDLKCWFFLGAVILAMGFGIVQGLPDAVDAITELFFR